MSYLKSLSAKLAKALALYGGWGLFGIALLDSAGVSMPGVKDFLLIYLSSKDPGRAWMYAGGCIIGTVIGSFVICDLSFVVCHLCAAVVPLARHEWQMANGK